MCGFRAASCLQVTIGSTELKANHMIRQDFEFPQEGEKYTLLMRLLEREMDGSRILIFCETKRGCDAVTRDLRQNGWPALAIHGDKSQQERDWVLGVRHEHAPASQECRPGLCSLTLCPCSSRDVVRLVGAVAWLVCNSPPALHHVLQSAA